MNGPAAPAPRYATLGAMLEAAGHSEQVVVLVDGQERDRSVSWRTIHLRARQVAFALVARGVRSGDRVGLVLPTGEGFLDAFFGTVLAGAIPVPLYPPVRLGRLEEWHLSTARMLTIVGAKAVLTDGRVHRLLGQVVERARPELGCLRIEGLVGTEPGEGLRSAVDAEPDSPALIQFSSGSTVDPKPVVLTHRALMAQLAALEGLLLGDGKAPVGASWLPLYHDMGLIGALLVAVYCPGKLVLLPPELFLAKPAAWLRAISRHRVTISPAPSFAYALCLKRIRPKDLEGVDLSSWAMALNGAEPISAEVMRRFCERFTANGLRSTLFVPVYGLSEAALAVTFSAAGAPIRSLGVDARTLAREGKVVDGTREIVSVGTPIPGVAVEVRDASGHVLPDRVEGRIWVRGPSVMKGYFGQDEASAKALVDGWLDTGDLGFTKGGNLYICGRAKDVVIIRGANHAPREFEEAVEQVPGVRAGCAVAVGFQPESGEEALLLLVERARESRAVGDRLLEARIRDAVLERTGVAAHTVLVLEPGTLPRTSSGKLRRSEALRAHLSGTLNPPRALGPVGLASELLRSAVGHARSGRA